jgi:hypothetical protein
MDYSINLANGHNCCHSVRACKSWGDWAVLFFGFSIKPGNNIRDEDASFSWGTWRDLPFE